MCTAAQMSRVLEDLKRGPIARAAYSGMYAAGVMTFEPVDTDRLSELSVPITSRLIDAMRNGNEEALAISTEYKICNPTFMAAWLNARRAHRAKMAAKNDLTV